MSEQPRKIKNHERHHAHEPIGSSKAFHTFSFHRTGWRHTHWRTRQEIPPRNSSGSALSIMPQRSNFIEKTPRTFSHASGFFVIFAYGTTKYAKTTMILTYYTATTMIIIAYLLGSIPERRVDRQEILRDRHPRTRLEKRRNDQHAPRAGTPGRTSGIRPRFPQRDSSPSRSSNSCSNTTTISATTT